MRSRLDLCAVAFSLAVVLPSFALAQRIPQHSRIYQPQDRSTIRRVSAQEVVIEGPEGSSEALADAGGPPLPPGYAPWQTRVARVQRVAQQPEAIEPGTLHQERVVSPLSQGTVLHGGPLPEDMVIGAVPHDGCASCGVGPVLPGEMMVDGCGGCGACDACGPPCCLVPCPDLRNSEVFVGVQGFTNWANQSTGSFGFHQGVNWGVPIRIGYWQEIGYQLGFRAVQSNLGGSALTDEARSQVFATMGFFRRVDWGLQWGVVVDYQHDGWYHSADLAQVRGEIGWVNRRAGEIGFWFASAVNEDELLLGQNRVLLEATDIYAAYWRFKFPETCNATGRLFAGVTAAEEGVLGADFETPINSYLALRGGFTYLIPDETLDEFRVHEESWNVAFSLVWRPGRNVHDCGNYYRPLLPVADNGSFIIDRQR